MILVLLVTFLRCVCLCHEILNRTGRFRGLRDQFFAIFCRRHYACNLVLLLVRVGGSPCLVVIVDLLGSAHMDVVVVARNCVFLGSLSGVRRSHFISNHHHYLLSREREHLTALCSF